MGRKLEFTSRLELQEYKKIINTNLKQSAESLKFVLESNDAIVVFDYLKYNKIVFDPITGEKENLIEMINQYQTYLVTIKALDYLFEKYPNKSFAACFGNISGYDIESKDGEIIAECFAAVSYKNNQKLNKDLKRLDLVTEKNICYEFFYDKEFGDKDRILYESKFPKISIIKFENLKI